MTDYSDPKYHNLYEEILKDQQWTWGKFSPVPYPIINQLSYHEQQRTKKIARTSNQSIGTN